MNQNTEMTLDQLAAFAGEDEGFELDRGGNFTKKLKMEVTYPVKILSQEVTVSEKNGYYVVKFELGVIKSDGSIGTGDKIVMCLPTFSDTVLANGDPEKLRDLKKNWGTQLHGMLRAVDPEHFQIFAESKKVNGKWKFFNSDGTEMTAAEKKTREQYISKAVTGVALAMVHEKYSVVNKTCYFVWAPNKTPGKDPYANFWGIQPDKYPLADE